MNLGLGPDQTEEEITIRMHINGFNNFDSRGDRKL